MIHVYGDSHSRIYDGFKRCPIDKIVSKSTTIYSCNLEEYKYAEQILPGDLMIFVFGEIDLRCRIQQHTKNNNSNMTIANLFKTYVIKLKEFNRKHPEITIILNSPPPPARKDADDSRCEYPVKGTLPERIQNYNSFIKKLEETCEENGYIFFHPYEIFRLPVGEVNPSFLDKWQCHIQMKYSPIVETQFIHLLVKISHITSQIYPDIINYLSRTRLLDFESREEPTV